MRKLLMVLVTLVSFSFAGLGTEAMASAPLKTNPQIRIQIGQRHRRDRREYREREYRIWNTTETRIVHEGWRTYRDTYQVRHFPDGRVQTIFISRVRID